MSGQVKSASIETLCTVYVGVLLGVFVLVSLRSFGDFFAEVFGGSAVVLCAH